MRVQQASLYVPSTQIIMIFLSGLSAAFSISFNFLQVRTLTVAIKILMIIFVLFLFLTAWYFFFALNQEKFLIFNISQNSKVKTLIKTTAILLIIMGFIGIFITFTLPKMYNFITLGVSALIMVYFSFRFTSLNA